jgi:hypothetical protein
MCSRFMLPAPIHAARNATWHSVPLCECFVLFLCPRANNSTRVSDFNLESSMGEVPAPHSWLARGMADEASEILTNLATRCRAGLVPRQGER